MNYKVIINISMSNHEVPDLRQLVGWERRDEDYPLLFERCNFWAGARDECGKLIGFGYICGMGLEHGYLEDIMIHPEYQKLGIGNDLVKKLLRESKNYGLKIITASYAEHHTKFYETCGFEPGFGGVWRYQ